MKTYIVIPAYNEQCKIQDVLEDIKQLNENIVVVNDGSTDNTLSVLKSIPQISVLNHYINRGQGAALKTGVDFALQKGAEIIVHFDADGQQNPAEIRNAIELLRGAENDIIIGSRFLGIESSNMPLHRKIVLHGGVFFTNFLYQSNFTDAHNGFRVMTNNAARKIMITQDRMSHASEITDEIVRRKLKWKEMPISVEYTDYSLTKGGQSSWNFIPYGFNMLWTRLMKK